MDLFRWFQSTDYNWRLSNLSSAISAARDLEEPLVILSNGREDLSILPAKLPRRGGLAQRSSQARLLHDLAAIEMQAMEIAVKTLCDYRGLPERFEDELTEIAMGEGEHLRLCLDGLESYGYKFGDFPFHNGLWFSSLHKESLLWRVLRVHRHLEASGLDAGEAILRRISGLGKSSLYSIVSTIVREEIEHVAFGSKWYREICRQLALDSNDFFAKSLPKLLKDNPRKERLSLELRRQAGFSEYELFVLKKAMDVSNKIKLSKS